VPHSPSYDIVLVEDGGGTIQLGATAGGEAQVIEPDPKLVEAILTSGSRLVAQAQDERAVAEQRHVRQRRDDLKATDRLVECDRAIELGHAQGDVVDGAKGE